MKVLQILPELNSGGVERGTLEVAEYLVKNGHEALVVSNGGRQVEALEKLGGRHIAMPVHRKSLSTLFQVKVFRALLEKEKPDILHIRSRVPGWVAWLAWRKMDPATRPRLVSTVHGFYSVNFYSAVMTKGERVIAVSNSIKDYILKNYPKTPIEKIKVIFRGIDPLNYPPHYQAPAGWLRQWKNENPQLDGKRVFLLPGRITRLKGHTDFFELLDGLKHQGYAVHGLVVGDTHPEKRAYLEELRAWVRDKGIEDLVTFIGHRSDVREIMAVSDVVCALSQQPESFGRTVLEALAISKPVLGYDCGGVSELLGVIFPKGRVKLMDSAGLLQAAVHLMDGNFIPKVPDAAFTLDSMCEATLELYRELVRVEYLGEKKSTILSNDVR